MTTLVAGSTAYASVTTTWDLPPAGWTSLRLVRNNTGSPRTEEDGEVLFTDAAAGARTSYLDTELTASRYYYYALYTQTAGVWTQIATTSILTSKDWGYTAKLYSRLPEVFKELDSGVEDETSFLWRFLSVFGFQLDYIRTETDTLKNLRDAILVNQDMLPPLASEVGIDYEPEIGTRSLRRFIANAIHLWSIKGTIPGVRELASVITGYVVHVRVGRNLALDNLDAGPSTDVGRWRGYTNCTVAYRANDVADLNPAGEGVRIFTAAAAGAIAGRTFEAAGDTPLHRLGQAIPVLPSTAYLASQYLRVASGAASTSATTLTWLDAAGVVIGATAVGPNATLNGSWNRPALQVSSPATARYVIPGFQTGALAAAQQVEHCGFMLLEGTVNQNWQCAREILVYLDAELINYVGNTSGTANEAYGWSAGVSAVIDPTLGAYLTKFVPDPEDPNIIVLLDAFAVDVTGDAVPPPPPPADSFATTVVYYSGAHQAVAAGQTWTVLAEATPPSGDPPGTVRTARVGFRLYNGAALVGDTYGLEVELVDGAWTELGPYELTVPAGAAYDHVEVALSMEGLCGFRHVALEQANQLEAVYFDGSTPSATGDYLWEGAAFRSPTHFYERRSSRTVRLRGLLQDYLPHGACFDVVFATVPSVTPQSVAGVNPDPMTSLPL